MKCRMSKINDEQLRRLTKSDKKINRDEAKEHFVIKFLCVT